jgi:hypothetical protein
MRVRLKGINTITKKLADGTRRTYWYAWKGGPPLRGKPGTPEFVASFNEAIARKIVPPRGTMLSVLQGYQASDDFIGLAESTRRGYVGLIRRIEKEFSDFPLSALTDRRTRGIFMAWRDRYVVNSGRRQADYAWSVLARILSWGLDRGLVLANPCARGGRLYRATPCKPLSDRCRALPLKQGQADRSKAAAPAEARLVNPDQATTRGQNARLGHVQSGHRQ